MSYSWPRDVLRQLWTRKSSSCFSIWKASWSCTSEVIASTMGFAGSLSLVRIASSAVWAASWNTVMGTPAEEARAGLMSSLLNEPFQSTRRRCGSSCPGWYS